MRRLLIDCVIVIALYLLPQAMVELIERSNPGQVERGNTTTYIMGVRA